MGPDGLRKAALSCRAKAHYLKEKLEEAGLKAAYANPFFHEFVTEGPHAEEILKALDARDMLGGLPLGGGRMLWCATEVNTRKEMDRAAETVREVLGA